MSVNVWCCSGMPLSGIAARSSMMLKSPPSSMGGTYGANAVSAAAACATIDVITQVGAPLTYDAPFVITLFDAQEGLLDNATQRGQQLMGGLRRLADKHPGHVAEVCSQQHCCLECCTTCVFHSVGPRPGLHGWT
jgi:4-aminobutyrate aminotransferase-like enzyme